MSGFHYSGKDLAHERRMTIQQCAKIAEDEMTSADGEGEIYIARKIANKILSLLSVSSLEPNK
jgi:hypothetical protein